MNALAGMAGLLREAAARACDRVRASTGWRRIGIAAGAGLVSASGFAPFGFFPLFLTALAILVMLVDGAASSPHRIRGAALAGWAFGFGQFLAGLYWVGYAFTVDAQGHAWQIPFVAVLLPGGLALFPAAACAGFAWVWRPGGGRILLFAACYAVAEWLRGHILTGFPWNLSAYSWGASLAILQSTAVIGAYGLSILTVLLGASLAELASLQPRARRLPAALVVLFGVLWIGGALRLGLVHPVDVEGVRLRLVQPNVPQTEKYVRALRARNWRDLIVLSTQPASVKPTHIIWPEAAPPFLLTALSPALDQIAALTQGNRVLMTGTVRVTLKGDNDIAYFNSFYVFAHGGSLIRVYDKSHLVPFGEYLPMAPLLHRLGLTKLVNMPDGFQEGPGPRTLSVPGAPATSPLICYEIIFPGSVVGTTRPGWLVNVTDDSWFGPSTGPYQHLLIARVRAIEEGLPVARAANTGISAVIDPLGRVITELGLQERGVIDSNLPQAMPITGFARFGEVGFALIVFACALGGLGWNRLAGKNRDLI
jgi:apolipoprotein N-acyltransferase